MRITLLLLGSLFSVCAYADVYKCTDTNGKTNYQAKPCDPERKTEQINIKTGNANVAPDQETEKQLLAQKEQAEKLEQERLQKKQAEHKQEVLSASAKNQFMVKNNPEKFSPFSIPPYDPDKLPELVKSFQTKLPEIERLRGQAAEKALASGQCTRVEGSELHSKSTKKALVFSVDCSNGKNFLFTEQELNK